MSSGRSDHPLQEWDVIIVGAGPAGSALARRLRPGCRVLLLERPQAEAAGGQRIGESLPGAARVLLRRLGMYDRFLAQGHVERGALVSQWDLDTPTWFDPVRDPHETGWHLDRARFDAGLKAAAIEAGASQYHQRLGETYAAVSRYSHEGFWRRRTAGRADQVGV